MGWDELILTEFEEQGSRSFITPLKRVGLS